MAKESLPPSIEVEIVRQQVQNIRNSDGSMMDQSCSIHVFNYHPKWHKDQCEPDEKGVLCRQTIFLGAGNTEKTNKFRIYIREGNVFRVVMPVEGAEVIIKSYSEKGETIKKKWVRKK